MLRNACVGLTLFLVAGSTGWDRAIAADFTLKLGHTTAMDAQDEIAHLFAKEVETRSSGKIKVQIYNASQLGNDVKMNRDVRSGAQEGIIQPIDFMVTFVPAFGALQVPGLFSDYDTQVKVLTGKNNAIELLNKRVQAVGLEIVALYPVGFTQLATTFPIKTFEDLKGHKIRARGAPELVLETRILGRDSDPAATGGGVHIITTRTRGRNSEFNRSCRDVQVPRSGKVHHGNEPSSEYRSHRGQQEMARFVAARLERSGPCRGAGVRWMGGPEDRLQVGRSGVGDDEEERSIFQVS